MFNSLNPWMYLNLEEPDRFSTRYLFPLFACFAEGDGEDGGGGGGEGDGDGDGAGDGDGDKDWKAEHAKEVTQSKKYRQRAQAAEKQVVDLQGTADRALTVEEHEQWEQMKKDVEGREQQELVAKGEFAQALEKAEQKFEGQRDKYRADADAKVEAADARTAKAMALAKRFAGDAPLALALASAGVLKNSMGIALGYLSPRVKVEFNDNDDPVITCVDLSGEVITDPDGAAGQSVTVERFVKDALATPEGETFLPPSGDTGSDAHKGGGAPKGDKALYERLLKDFPGRNEYMKENGDEAWYELERKFGK